MLNHAKLARFWEWGRKIVCVGRNYRDHCKELNNPEPKEPLIFTKPVSSYVKEGRDIVVPKGCNNLHHEVELGVVIGKSGSKISQEDAMDHVAGYVLALDMTARDWQDTAKSKGWPWDFAKGFDTSCPISDFIVEDKILDPMKTELWLKVNGELRQEGNTGDMIFPIPRLISHISQVMSLEAGDLILTGTPQGVGQVKSGDVIQCGIADDIVMTFKVSQKS